VKTLQEVRDRCRIEDGHWLWGGPVDAGCIRIHAPDYNKGGKQTSQQGRRAVWYIKHKKPIPAGWRVYVTCDESMCLNPAHIECMDPKEWGRRKSQAGDWKGVTARIIANRKASRKRSHIKDQSMLEYILTSPKTGMELSDELGVSRSTISRVRVGRATAFAPVGGLFTGLLMGAQT
jgi:hypothetical protein